MDTTNEIAEKVFRHNRRLFVIIVTFASLFLATPALPATNTLPPLPPPPGEFLNAWHFDDTNNWTSFYGYPAKKSYGVKGVPSWQSNAVQITGTSAFLQYREIETNGVTTNITCDNGTIYAWFVPQNWNSGVGPGVYGRLLDVGTYTTNASVGWFSLYLDPKGTNIFFSGQTNGAGTTYLTGSVS